METMTTVDIPDSWEEVSSLIGEVIEMVQTGNVWVFSESGLYSGEVRALAHEVLITDEVRGLVERIRNGDLKAREKLIESNLRLVHWVARKYTMIAREKGIDMNDLIQDGRVGLIEAIETFDPDKGSFATYAVWFIKKEILSALSEGLIHIPRNVSKSIQEYFRARKDFLIKQGRYPSLKELAKLLGISMEDIMELQDTFSLTHISSLHAPIGEEGDSVLMDMIPDKTALPDESVEHTMLGIYLRGLLDEISFTDRERYIISMYYWLEDDEEKNFSEISQQWDVSEARTHQIHKSAIQKFRTHLSRKKHLHGLHTIS